MPKLWIDTDPGIDDALALLLALRSPSAEIVGVSLVAGNTTLERATRNARGFLGLLGAKLPLYRGSQRPLLRPLVTAEHVHGKGGLAGVALPPSPLRLSRRHAVDALIQEISARPGEITVVTLGPLTNLALALLKEPRLARRVGRLVVMGGALGAGNITPSAEYNIYLDPEAAHIVLTAGIPTVMVGLEVTHRVVLGQGDVAQIAAVPGTVSQVVARLVTHLLDVHEGLWGQRLCPLHDPCAVAVALDPSLVRTERMTVEVERTSPLTRGRTVYGAPRRGSPTPTVEVAVEVEAALVLGMFKRALGAG